MIYHKCRNPHLRMERNHCRAVRVAFHFLLVFGSRGLAHCSYDSLQRLGAAQPRESFREIPVKVHIRRPDRDAWVYVGRASVSLDTTGHASQVGEPSLSAFLARENPDQHSIVVRSASSDKILAVFSEVSPSFNRHRPLTHKKHRAANFRPKSVVTLSLLDVLTGPRWSRGH